MVWAGHVRAAAHAPSAEVRAAPGRAAAVNGAAVRVGQRCYAVGQRVAVSGSGFGDGAPYDVAIDGVDFGQSVTSASGGFSIGLFPGGLGAGQAQIVDQLTASDGSTTATATFTITRATGALFGAGSGSSPRRDVPFQVWDFAPRGPEVTVYLHYVAPGGAVRRSVKLGTTTGQCGALVTAPLALFPFSPSRGTWTLQFDTASAYSTTPAGKVARLKVAIS
jgi:hypothetical protein